ncbi:MAG: glycosyltransferase family 2 protein, partial [Planctomycetota bacterium]
MAPETAGPRVAICMPAYQAAKTLRETLNEIPEDCYHDLVLGDDASTDGTAELAEKLGVPAFIEVVNHGVCDMLLGNRIRTRKECLKSGMPWWKYLSNRLLTITENVVFGVNLGEFHSGFRVYRRQLLEKIPFEDNSEGFVFDSQLIAQ